MKDSFADIVTFKKLEDDSTLFDLADVLLYGKALCLDCRDCNKEVSQKCLNFLSGVTYAIDGLVEKLQPNIFLLARKEQYKNTDIKKFLEQYKK